MTLGTGSGVDGITALLATACRGQAQQYNDSLDAWYRGETVKTAAYAPDSMNALNDRFQTDSLYLEMGERTKRDYLYNVKAGLEWADGVAARSITARAVRAWYRGQKADFGVATARNRFAAFRRLCSFGKVEGWMAENPCLGLRIEAPKSRPRVWTIQERDAFCAAALGAGRPSMALAVMLGWCLGQRPADLRTLPWSAYNGNAMALRQAKTGAAVWVPALPELRTLLDATPRRSTQIVVSENTTRPYHESDFQHTFADIRDKAGLPADLQYRDLRRTLATALGAAGCSEDQIKSITGHKTREVLSVYVVPDTSFAEGAMLNLERGGKHGS